MYNFDRIKRKKQNRINRLYDKILKSEKTMPLEDFKEIMSEIYLLQDQLRRMDTRNYKINLINKI